MSNRITAIQLRILARIGKQGDLGYSRILGYQALGGTTTQRALLRKGLIEFREDPPGTFISLEREVEATFSRVFITDLGKRILIEKASDSSFGVAINFSRTRPIYNGYQFFDCDDCLIATVWPYRIRKRSNGVAAISLYDRLGLYHTAIVDNEGTDIRGGPSGGWCRLLDLAITAGLKIKEIVR